MRISANSGESFGASAASKGASKIVLPSFSTRSERLIFSSLLNLLRGRRQRGYNAQIRRGFHDLSRDRRRQCAAIAAMFHDYRESNSSPAAAIVWRKSSEP